MSLGLLVVGFRLGLPLLRLVARPSAVLSPECGQLDLAEGELAQFGLQDLQL